VCENLFLSEFLKIHLRFLVVDRICHKHNFYTKDITMRLTAQ
jgi:hypothetical protein